MESKHYGEIIQKIRQDRNMSLKEAAGDAITPNNLSRFEKGLSTVKVDTFFYLLDKLFTIKETATEAATLVKINGNIKNTFLS